MRWRARLFAAACAFVCAATVATSAQQGAAGYVETLRGQVLYLSRDVKDRTKAIALDAVRDVARRLYPGDQLQCQAGAVLRIRRGAGVEDRACPSPWFTITAPPSAQARAIQAALDQYGRVGGISRAGGQGLEVFSPSPNGAEIPERATIRWSPGLAAGPMSLILRDASGGGELWRQDQVDSAAGSLQSAAYRQALVVFSIRKPTGTLALRVIDAGRSEVTTEFSLLSATAVAALDAELGEWAKAPDPLYANLGRAGTYGRARLFAAAASAYEAALAAAPGSEHLLKRTVDAFKEAGNFRRANELAARLPR